MGRKKKKLNHGAEVCLCDRLGKHNLELIMASTLSPIIPPRTSSLTRCLPYSNPDHFQMQIAALHSNLPQQSGESICIHKLGAIAISLKQAICIFEGEKDKKWWREREKKNKCPMSNLAEKHNQMIGLFTLKKMNDFLSFWFFESPVSDVPGLCHSPWKGAQTGSSALLRHL